jgi:predicted DCC family thiol-disulfide oxidoreductase YuxK
MPKAICYYDGACGLCRTSIRALKAIDWLGRIRGEDLTRLPDAELPVTRQEAIASITLKTPGGRVFRGMRAVRAALVRTPLGVVPGALLYIPGFSHAGHALYKWVSTNRTRDEPPYHVAAPDE